MAGFKVGVKINDKGIAKKLSALEGKMKNPTGFYKGVGEQVLKSTLERFGNEQAPDGSKWQALSPVTKAARLKKGGNAGITILRNGGDLIGSVNYRASKSGLAWGSALAYSAIHQFGGEAGRGKSVTIPARPFLGISADDEQRILGIAKDWVDLEGRGGQAITGVQRGRMPKQS